ncbi:hypothetical protein OEA41_009157 [Lepraria neglecta]|uniref:Uncharacterized protein n=1 Tax=Lepraria neglecta TaxID=209136 RepID=A0AAD9Z338_9LECA|nr:hypothetical protein OEA41_009157 [Lepraria neglecta]
MLAVIAIAKVDREPACQRLSRTAIEVKRESPLDRPILDQDETEDIDIVIAPPARLREAKNALRSDPRFFIDPRTRHTTFTSSISPKQVEIEFLSFPGTFKAPFDESTKVMKTRSGLNVLHLPFLLESKCRAISSRSKESKRTTDAFDIGFILEFMVKNNLRTSLAEVPSTNREFQAWFEDFKSGSTRLFHQVGL